MAYSVLIPLLGIPGFDTFFPLGKVTNLSVMECFACNVPIKKVFERFSIVFRYDYVKTHRNIFFCAGLCAVKNMRTKKGF